MKLENRNLSAGRILLGCLLGVIWAFVSPLLVVSEAMSLMFVIALPALGLVVLYRWAGLAPALLSALLQLLFVATTLGGTFTWAVLFTCILPLVVLFRLEESDLQTQMSASVAAFGAGLVCGVVFLFQSYGGNMTERFLQQLPRAMRELSVDRLGYAMETLGAALGRNLSQQDFYKLFEDAVTALIPVYQLNIPGKLFGGAVASAALCVGLNSYMLQKRKGAKYMAYLPLRRWALSASATGGVLFMLCVSLGYYISGGTLSQALFYTVYNIAQVVFCIQALSSMARFMYASSMKKGLQNFLLIAIVVLCAFGASLYVGMYGFASAIFGRYGLIRLRVEKTNRKNEDHSDDENRGGNEQ